jgi:hypothetical protein
MKQLDLDLCNKVVEVKQVHPDWGRTRIAKHVGCSEGQARTILDRYSAGELTEIVEVSGTASEDLKLQKQKKDTNNLRGKYVEALQYISDLEEQLDFVNQYKNLQLLPSNFKILPKDPREAVAVVLASDWHIDEVVNGNAIGGLNEFNLAIAKQRIQTFFENSLLLMRMVKSESTIRTLVFGALGDFISGWIHPELLSSNSMTPPECIPVLFDLLSNGLKFLLDEGDIDKLIFVASCGNHARITVKPEFKNSPKKSYEWPIYNLLAKWFADGPYAGKIEFKLPTGYFNMLNILGKNVRFHHGDGVSYHGGVGGIHIPLRKSIAQWNKGIRADLDCLGHWHTRESSRDYVINGSLIGFNEYAERIKADFEPPQQSFFIIHPKHGKTNECGISLGK